MTPLEATFAALVLAALGRWVTRIAKRVMFPWRAWRQVPDPVAVRGEDSFWAAEVERLVRWLRNNTSESVVSTQGEVGRHLDAVRNYLVRIPDEVFEEIRSQIQTGHRDGDAIPAIADRVQAILTVTGSEIWPNRAQTIAVTEVNGAANAGWFAGAVEEQKQLGVPLFKKWIATHDSHTRSTHRQADGQIVPLLSPFIVGTSPLLYPGDKAGPPEEVINCRCTAAVVEGP